MSQDTRRRMDRRSFLRAAGGMAGALAWGRSALARRLLLVTAGQTSPISQVEWILYDTGLLEAAGTPRRRCALRLTTTGGAQGWADFESWTAPVGQTVYLIKDILLGQDPADHEAVWLQLHQQGVPLATLSAIDVALWDLRGRLEGQPVHALLGTRRDKAKSLVGTGFNLGEPPAYAEFASACQAKNIHGVKVQPYVTRDTPANDVPGTGFPDQDMAVYSAVHDAVGPDLACIAGSPAAYTYEQALQVGRCLDDLGYAWYQSPMPEDDLRIGQYVTLAGEIQTPVSAPQADPGSYQSRITWFERGACDIPCIDVHHGGLTACLYLASACAERGIPLNLNGVGPDAYAHLQLAGATDETLLEYVELRSLSQEPATMPGRTTPEPTFDEQGYVAVPQGLGMGVELDWKYIFTHRIG